MTSMFSKIALKYVSVTAKSMHTRAIRGMYKKINEAARGGEFSTSLVYLGVDEVTKSMKDIMFELDLSGFEVAILMGEGQAVMVVSW